ncbi:hypothetical protein K2173_011564 [Erythroxylum novogranatense]|uniref:RING-type domain-containing protein n=1 Tax=Erythroxylum novogranatense TaxID=1862640 RepID=A0AAV8S5F0_9ROSI|nr:hypothetical protein K2173_011564 [Erythroxylum novogranatense]
MASPSPESIFLEDFGQKVDLTRRIREVLLNYPEGTTVLKELIQNADDAGATVVRLCLDRRLHGSNSLLSPSLAQWQGSSLLAFNDAVFTEEDFVSISRIGGSAKHGQAWKTGRFGIGFNSVYHLTDLPSFVSGNYVVLFDPQGSHLPNVSSSNPGKRIDYVSTSAISFYEDQFSPYVAFGCDMRTPFAGTLFRFPLRNATQAATSKLSRQAYSDDDILAMLGQLYQEGVLSLLFLKSVVSIEMYVWDAGGLKPRKLYSCGVNSLNEDVVWHRQALLRMSGRTLNLDTRESETDAYLVEFVRESSVVESNIETKIDRFYIVQSMAPSSSRIASFAATACKEYDIHLLPWASVAACLSDNDDLKLGQAFCFLPLPVRTGLNVQINGYFEVSSNRRGIWYGADMDRSGKIRSIWNRLLLEDVVASNFRYLLLGLQGLVGATDSYYTLFPSGSFEDPWSILVENIYKNVCDAPVLHSELEGGKWVAPVQAFLHDEEFNRSKELSEALLQLGMPIVHLPNSLLNMFLKYASGFQKRVVTPDTVRHFLRDCKSVMTLSKSYKLVLLEYCLEDLIDSDVGAYLNNLPLLPLANGDFGSLSEASKGVSYFICNDLEYMLLDQISNRIVDRDIPINILERLSAVAESSRANIMVFSIEYFIKLFHRFVPTDWRHKTKVSYNPDSCHNHPTFSWFVLFWQYLRYHCEKLSAFGDWPILPSTSGHLYRPSRQSKLIDAHKLPVSIQETLFKIGCKMLDPTYGVDHSDLSLYVSDANYTGVLESILDVLSSNGGKMQPLFENLKVEEKDELRIFLLDPRWYMGDCVDGSKIGICKLLPIFKVYSGGSVQGINFSDLENPEKYLPPLDVPENLLGCRFVLSSSNEEHLLLRFYGIERMGRGRFYKEHVFNNIFEMQPEVRNGIMLSVLQNLPQLSIEDTSFRSCLRSLEFVPTLSGDVKCPEVLYDPRNEELCALLDDSESFPFGAFQEPDILDILLGLGLKTSVSPETIIESARQIERLMRDDQYKAHSRGQVLLSYLEVNAMKWSRDQLNDNQGTVNRKFSRATTAFRPHNLKSDVEKFWNDMRMICWCPVLVSAPFQTIPWPTVSSTVAPPKLVRLQTDLWLVSASMRILDGDCVSTALSYNLGWLSPPGGSVIAAQLLELGKNNEIVYDQILRQELTLAMPRIYSIMASIVGSDEMDIVKAVLEGSRWIWVGDGFATVDEVVLNGPLHLAPYVRVIPIDLAVFKDLFLELGVREYFKPIDYVDILGRMAFRKGSSPLDAQEIRAAILIVQHLAEAPLQERQVEVYLPDVSGRLFLSSDLVYNDAPWLLGSDDPDGLFASASTSVALNAKKAVQKFVHGNISNEVAEKLGVCSLRRMLLAQSADSMNLSLSGAAEAFGQHEALTTRLKHILEMYADGPGILFELVQNAEDAGATEVTFLLDNTQYGTSSVLSPEMADWQGAALYCFNDSVFSPQDLYAISRIGQESKLEKPFAIGRFGLGFNCVYHFTDLPMFVSGENIVMFDPHACNLPGISPSHPGLRIKYVGRKILEQFPDQFSPFLHFGCDMQHPFEGTLFRFPLRSAAVAQRSQIKKQGYAREDVLSLFTSFSGVVCDTLLFLRNVKRISIFVKEGNNSNMQLLHRVQRNSIIEPEMESSSLNDMFNIFNGSRFSGLDKDQLLKKLSKSVGRDLPHKCQKIVVTEQSLSTHISHFWITVECLGGGQANYNRDVANNKLHKSIPWACVAAYINSAKGNGNLSDNLNFDGSFTTYTSQDSTVSIHSMESFEGRAFCFLPLPINTGLPAHINAYFELSSNRRDIWFGNDMAGAGKLRSDWNVFILEEIVAPAYGWLLEKIALEIGPCDLFFSYWPTATGLEPWASVVRKLYRCIAEFGLRVLYTKARGGQWITAKQALFPDFAFHKDHELVEALSDADLPVICISKPLVEQFMEASPMLNFVSPQLLRRILIRRKRGFKDRKAIIVALEYCLLDLEAPTQLDGLYGLSLIPLADGSFASIERHGTGERIYVARAEEYDLLKDSVPHQLVDQGIPEVVHGKLCDIAKSGKSNICFISCTLLEKLLVKLLPAEWQFSKKVTWFPGSHGQPSLDWIRLLWSYLNMYCDDLSVFSKWPILPVGEHYLFQLVPNSFVIKEGGWSENMSSLLLKIGCVFLRKDFPIEHPQLEKFVQSPTAAGILNACIAIAGKLDSIEGVFTGASEGELHELRNFVFQTKWFIEEKIDAEHIDIIKHLPVFESYGSRKLVSLRNPTKWLKPNGIREDLLGNDFVRIESEREGVILRRYLEIKEPSKVEFYKVYVLNRMSEFVSNQGALSAILHDVKHLIEDDISIKSVLSTTPFVLAEDGSWQQPSRLYDPRHPELRKVLHREAFFPSAKFSDPESLEVLVRLGLKTTLGFAGFLDCAKSVSMLYDSGDPEAVNYGRKLFACLDGLALKLVIENAEKGEGNCIEIQNGLFYDHSTAANGGPESSELDNNLCKDLDIGKLLDNLIDDKPEEEFWTEVKAIAWCPILPNSPFEGLPWLKSSNQVSPPNIVRPKSQMWLVSGSMNILDSECDSLYLQHKLGWMDRPKVDALSMQLIELSKSYGQFKLQSSINPCFHAALQEGIPLLYSKLQEYIGTDDFMRLKSTLDGVSWVWIGDDFVSSNVLAFDSPAKYTPYLYVVPSELSDFRELLLELGVRLSFDTWDYFHVLQRLQNDVKGAALSLDQLSFVHCVVEAITDCCLDKPLFEASSTPLLLPDSSGVLMSAADLVYDDAPWIQNKTLAGKHFLHPSISNDLANKLGLKSLRCLSLVDEDTTKDLPCMGFAKLSELLSSHGNDFLLFDLLELADCCKAKKLHVIFDKRDHPSQSLLQHNLGEFQGPALVAILEGVTLSREELGSLQLLPPWRLRGDTLNYGLGLLSCFSVSDLMSIVSGGYFYMFDPHGLALSVPSSCTPAAKVFSLIGSNLVEQFPDQFRPMLIDQDMPWSSVDSTVIRMPLSSECLKDGLEMALKRVNQIYERFMEHASRALIFLKSVLQVSLSTWNEGMVQPHQDCSVFIDSSSARMRNPFSEKNWRKFQLSRLFSSSNAATKLHMIDVKLYRGSTKVVDRWLLVLSLGSGQTRNMALDRRYLAYNLTPVAGVAAHLSRDGLPAVHAKSSVLSPLPLSGILPLPVTILGCFLVRHNGSRSLFKCQDTRSLAELQPDPKDHLIEAWNRELMSCVCDSYVELVVEINKLTREPSGSIESGRSHAIAVSLKSFGELIYSFWPRSIGQLPINPTTDGDNLFPVEVLKADWECLIDKVIRPFYIRVSDLPVWQLYSGSLVKSQEGMFLSQPGNGVGDNLLPATVCGFVKEHYPVFSVPWELVSEIQAVGVAVREIKPKMVRDLLRVSSNSIALRSVETYVDVLEYCLSDIDFPGSSSFHENPMSGGISSSGNIARAADELGRSSTMSFRNLQTLHGSPVQNAASGDALEMMTSLGKALFDFGRGVVEDIGRAGGPLNHISTTLDSSTSNFRNGDPEVMWIAAELKGLPCPTATNHLARLGTTELWLGNKDQQALMKQLAAKFIHSKVLERSTLSDTFSRSAVQRALELKSFSLHLMARHIKFLFHANWVNHVMGSNMAPWFSWVNSSVSGGEGGPSHEWIRLFWKCFNSPSEDIILFSDWPLIPAFLGRPVLCRVKERHLVFFPPYLTRPVSGNSAVIYDGTGTDMTAGSVDHIPEYESTQSYNSAFDVTKKVHPWLFPLLNQLNIPIFDAAFVECAASCDCLPAPGHSLGQIITSKLVAAKSAGYFHEFVAFSDSDRDKLFKLLANDFFRNGYNYGDQEVEALRSLPIYKTAVGSFTTLHGQDQCMISSNSFLKPCDAHCLSYSTDSAECSFFRALGVPELQDQQILIRFGLPGFENKPQSEQDDILFYLYMNWQDLQSDSSLLEVLKETKFVRNADEFSTDLFRPKDLLDPNDALLTSVFSNERQKFPGERFTTDRWLRILRKVGLHTAAESDIILECAKKVESLGSESMKCTKNLDDFEVDLNQSHGEVSMEIWALAGSVVEAVFSNFAVLYGNNFCNLLGKIACVPAELGFPNIAGKRVLTSYNDALLLKDWPLAWSSSPILSKANVVPPEYSWGALHLRSPPAFATVLKHLQVIGRNGGEDTLAHWPTVSGIITVDEASCEVLKYLDKAWGSLSSSDVKELKKVAFLPAANGTRLMTASSLFARLTINLSPFAFELPTLYLPYVKILKELGLQDVLSVSAAKNILSNIKDACGYKRLNPNELRAVMEILYFLCDTTTEANTSDEFKWKSDAIVPDDGCRLLYAKSCVYIDSYGSRYIKCIDTSKLRFVHPDLPERICAFLEIRKLSDVVIEELAAEENLLTMESIGPMPLALVREKLASKSFQDAVCNLLKSIERFTPLNDSVPFEAVKNSLEFMAEKIQFVRFIRTRFMLHHKSLDITSISKDSVVPGWEDGSRYRNLYFVNRSKTLILVAEPPNFISVVDVVAIVVSQVIGSPVPLPLGSLFLCPQGSETAALSTLKLGLYRKESEPTSNNLVGKEILSPDALQVQLHPLRPFYSGEIVAWRTQSGDRLRYGKVPEDVRPSAGQALYRFKVETTPGVIEPLLSSQVFSFKSISVGNESYLADSSDCSHKAVDMRNMAETSRKGRTKSSQATRELQYGRVSAEELVQAVHEMLSAAGINMDVEKQTLLQRTVSLQEQVKESQAALLLEQEKSNMAEKEAETAKAAWICRVCLSNEVDMTIIPCGHVLCRRCSSAVSRCPFCRLQVTKAIRIFRP